MRPTGKTNQIEKKLEKSKDRQTVLAYLGICWRRYVLVGDEKAFQQASHMALTMFQENPASVEYCFAVVFFHIQSQNYDRAADLLEGLHQYRNTFRNTDPVSYSWFLYLSALMQFRIERYRAAQKNFKLLEELAAMEGAWKPSVQAVFALHTGMLYMETGQFTPALRCFGQCVQLGCRSSLLYLSMHSLFQAVELTKKNKLLYVFVNWAVSKDGNFSYAVGKNQEFIDFTFCERTDQIKRLYERFESPVFLREIAERMMAERDFSVDAYRYYRLTELKQITVKNLSYHLVMAAFQNGIEDISRYTMKQFLSSRDIEMDLKGFIYHLLLTQKKYQEFAEEKAGEIMQFALYILENRVTGRAANSLYRFLLLPENRTAIPRQYEEWARNILRENLFVYEIRIENPDIAFVWIKEKEKKSMRPYALENGRALVTAVSESFTAICFNTDQSEIINGEPLKVVKSIANADMDLYEYFYENGVRTPELLITLAQTFVLAEGQGDGEGVYLYQAAILREALAVKDLSESAAALYSAALGHMLYEQERFDKALACYEGVNENVLPDKAIEQMLIVYIHAKEYEKAVSLIVKKSHCISDRTLFSSLKTIAAMETYNSRIADVACELLLRSWYDKTLLHIVLKHYKGCQEEWQELSRALASVSASVEELDEIILRNGISMHKFDEGSQRVYARMAENAPDNETVGLFTYYVIYEILVNHVKPLYETTVVLEKLYRTYHDRLLTYALCQTVLEHTPGAAYADELIQNTIAYNEEDGILLPVLKKMKDKKNIKPYIEKNQPFVYRSLPNKNVYLYYRFDENEEYRSVKMKYFRFGMYFCVLPHFFGDRLFYYYSEEMETGSVVTQEEFVTNQNITPSEPSVDPYFVINNALIYEQMFKYGQVEAIITDSLKELCKIRGGIL